MEKIINRKNYELQKIMNKENMNRKNYEQKSYE